MRQFPEWVPEEVISFYERLKTLPNGCTHTLDAHKLFDAMKSQDMNRAWKVITKRKRDASPWEFAQSILDVACMARYMSKYATPEEIAIYNRAARNVRVIATELKSVAKERVERELQDDLEYVTGRYFGIEPIKSLYGVANAIDSIARDMEETRTEMTAFVGKPGDISAKRHYVIRLLSTETERLYSTPLHEVVASTSGIILGEAIGPEGVRALLRTSKTTPRSILAE